MKKMTVIALVLILMFTMAACGAPPQSGFVSSGDNFAAQAHNEGLVLKLKKDTTSEKWINENESENFSIDSAEEHDDEVELRITAQKEGSGTIVLNHVKADGTVEAYHLTVTVSKPQRNRLVVASMQLTEAD